MTGWIRTYFALIGGTSECATMLFLSLLAGKICMEKNDPQKIFGKTNTHTHICTLSNKVLKMYILVQANCNSQRLVETVS